MAELLIKWLDHGEGLTSPQYETAGAAGMDLRAAVPAEEPIILLPGQRTLVPTGFCMALPKFHEGQVRPRSGLAVKHGITVLNSPGTIDEDYRGEVKVPIINHGQETFEIFRGLRIAQLVIAPVIQVKVQTTDRLDDSVRGEAGFGSTGA